MRSWDEVTQALARIKPAAPLAAGGFTLAQALAHCAQSIEYSVSGYPRLRSGLFRVTLGAFAKRRFLSRGTLSHDVDSPILGAPDLSADLSLQAGRDRLERAVAAFRSHAGALAPHLAYGTCSKEEYEQLHAMHIADHLGKFGTL